MAGFDERTTTFSRARVWCYAALSAAVVYLSTMAPGVLWGDSGDAQIRVLIGALTDARELARAHAPYYAVAIGLHRFTGADAAWVANLVAALAGVVTVANFAWLLTHSVRRRVSLVAGTAMLLLSHTLWQLSTGAEVVTFSTMCLSFELAAVVSYLAARKPYWLVLAALANGIGWSTHNLAMLTWPAYVVLMAMQWRRRPSAPALAAAGTAWLIGVLPLAVLTGMAYSQSGSVSDTVRSLLVGRYSRQVFSVDLGLGTAVRAMVYVAMNFPTPLILLAPWGWWRLRRFERRETWWFLTVAGGMYGLFAVRYRVPDQYTFFVHAYLFLVLFTAAGVEGLLHRWRSRRIVTAVLILSALGPPAYAVAPPIARAIPATRALLPAREIPYREPYSWFLRPWRTGYRGAERYANEVFLTLPLESVLILDEMMQPPLIYLQRRDRIRLDVKFQASRYLWDWSRPLELDSTTESSLITTGRLFVASTVRTSLPDWLRSEAYDYVPVGLIWQVVFTQSTRTRRGENQTDTPSLPAS
jgi:hypothetical protein